MTSIREIKLLKNMKHPNVIEVVDMAVEWSRMVLEDAKTSVSYISDVYMVMPYMENDLMALLEARDVVFTGPQVKCLGLQLLRGMEYLHKVPYSPRTIIHRPFCRGASCIGT